MQDGINQFLPSLVAVHSFAYWFAFFAALAETTLLLGLLVPGSTALLLLGAYAASGQLEFIGLWWFAVAGAVIGDNINYFLGRRYGHRWIAQGFWLIKPQHLTKAQGFFDRHGAKSVFLGRFIPSVKELMPFVAGTVQMRRSTFMLWNLLGAMGWGLEWLGAGYLFAHSLNLVQLWLPRLGLLLLVVLLLYLLIWATERFFVRNGKAIFGLLASVWHSVRTAIAGNEDVKRLVAAHPGVFQFIHNRLDRSHFSGLTLTLLVLSFGYVLILFGGIVEDLLSADPIIRVDQNISALVTAFRGPELLEVFTWITQLGNAWVVVPLALLSSLIFLTLGQRYLLLPLLAALLGSTLFTTLSKLAFARPRPTGAILLEHSYSFPSGHATLAVGFYGFLTYVLIRYARHWKSKVRWFFTGLTVALLLGLSRIIVDVHYLSDVWGGFLVGTLWLIIGISLTEWLVARQKINFRAALPRKQKKIALMLLATSLLYIPIFIALYQPNYAPPPQRPPIALRTPIVDTLHRSGLAYTHSLLGKPELPVGLAIIAASDQQLDKALKNAGWQTIKHLSLRRIWQELHSPQSLGQLSVAPAFWNGTVNDYTFIHRVPDSANSSIEALKIWKTAYRIDNATVYLGIVRRITKPVWNFWQHATADIDTSKAFLLETLQQSNEHLIHCTIDFVPPITGDFVLGDHFFTRGQFDIISLSDQFQAQRLCTRTPQSSSK